MGHLDDPSRTLSLRAATVDDAEAIAEVANEMFVAEIGEPWLRVEEVRDDLTRPGRHPAFPDMVALGEGALVAYLQFFVTPDRLEVSVFPHVVPRLWERGVNGWLLRIGEERIRAELRTQPPGTVATMLVARFANNEPARRLFEALAFRYERTFWMMRIDLTSEAEATAVPDGITVRTLDPERDVQRVYEVLAEAFSEHWGGAFDPYVDWRHHHVDGEGASFDPTLWFVAVDGDEIVGAASCIASSPRDGDAGLVSELGVRSGWRRRGIAQALLRTAFAEFARRGVPRAELSVDADNTTGATTLYERAGMRVAYAWEFWRKDLTAP